MFEGGFLLGLTAMAWVTLILIKHQPTKWVIYALFGVVTGFALSTKHSAAFTVVLMYSALSIMTIWRWLQTRHQQFMQVGKLALATFIAVIVFLALNPLWWSQPLKMPEIAIDERQKILDTQVALFGGYDSVSDRLSGLWEQGFRVTPQYFEADYWADYEGVETEIATYEDHFMASWTDDIVIFAARLLFTMFGLSTIFRGIRHGTLQSRQIMLMLLLWGIGIISITFFTVPLDWQRYYLQIQPPLILLMGLGMGLSVDKWLNNRSLYVPN
jgi:4-amino-4-deoxy-L-arabinose transferase-like glycosyltransferase